MDLKPYGVQYKPGMPTGPKISVKDLEKFGIRYIRITWVDLINNIRYRVLPLNYFKRVLESDRPGLSVPRVAFGLVSLQIAEGFAPIGEYIYVPDANTLRVCPYAEGHASIYGWFQEKVPPPNGGLEAELCPRTLLRKILQDASTAGYSFIVGVETEFYLLKSVEPNIVPLDNHDWSRSSATLSGSVASMVLEEIADTLQIAGIELEVYHAEAGPGQYEVVTRAMDPLEAADALVFTRETVYNVANKHECKASFAPRVFENSGGTSTHHHISIHSNEKHENASPSEIAPTLKHFERSFLQSLLDNLPALTCLTLPTAPSYARVVDGTLSAGTWVCWGNDNKAAPIRLCGSPGSHHFELKYIDGTSNPYLVMAGLVGAGMVGVKRGQDLTMRACDAMAYKLSRQERQSLGITNNLPRSIAEARESLDGCWELKGALGEEFVEKYLSVNRKLEEVLRVKDPEEEMKKLVYFY